MTVSRDFERHLHDLTGVAERTLTMKSLGDGIQLRNRLILPDALPFYPNLREAMLRLLLVHPGEFILPELGEKLERYADKKLEVASR